MSMFFIQKRTIHTVGSAQGLTAMKHYSRGVWTESEFYGVLEEARRKQGRTYWGRGCGGVVGEGFPSKASKVHFLV